MDLQILYGNPTPDKKEKKMRQKKLRKKNPVAVYRKAKVAADSKAAGRKGPSYRFGKVDVPSTRDVAKIAQKISTAVARVEKIPDSKKKLKVIADLKKKNNQYRVKVGKLMQKQQGEAKRMLNKGYIQEKGMTPKQGKAELKKEQNELNRAKKAAKAMDARIAKALKGASSISIGGKKRKKKKASKKVKRVTKRKPSKRKASKTVSKKKSSKRVSKKKSSKRKTRASKARRVKRKKNPITILSNPVEILENPKRRSKKKASKKVSKKKASKKVSKKKSKKRKSRKTKKSSMKKSAMAAVEAQVKPKKRKAKKRKSFKKAKALSAPKAGKKKKKNPSYKKSGYKLQKNPFGGAMDKVEKFTKNVLAHDLAEAGGLLVGGASIKAVEHLRKKFAPQISSMVAQVPFIGAFLEKNIDTILPLTVGIVVNKYVQNDKAQAVAKGMIGASVVNIGTSLYIAAAKMVDPTMAGIIAVPNMNGIIGVPEMGAMKMVGDFQGLGAQDITGADFGAPRGVGLSGGGGYIQDADYDSGAPEVVMPRQPDSLGGYEDIEYSDDDGSQF